MSEKIKVGIVFGGKSGEHEVSLMSSYNVIKAIDKSKFEPVLLGIDLNGNWAHYYGDKDKLPNSEWEKDEGHLNRKLNLLNDSLIDSIDIFFPVLHGTFGEDGTIQGLFEMLDKPYVGCGVLASALAMDKALAKVVFESVGINTAKGIILYYSEIVNDYEKAALEAERVLGNYPMFVKPANMGSSVGISKATDRTGLKAAVREAFKYDTKILIEEGIVGKEIEVAVLGNDQDAKATYPGQIVPCNEFYDYDAKYKSGDDSLVIIPAPIESSKRDEIMYCALKAYRALGCSGLSRVDFFLTQEGKIILNEINTLPGFTNISMYPKLWENCNVSYSELITKLIELGFDRYKKRKQLLYRKA